MPSIWVYDLESEKVLHRFEIPKSIFVQGVRGMASITIDVDANDCQNAYGYLPDLDTFNVYVYRLLNEIQIIGMADSKRFVLIY